MHEPVPRLLPVRSSYRASAHSLGLLGPLGPSSLKPFAWCESRRGEYASRAPCTQPWDPHHLCHPHRWLKRASWLSGVWSGCSSTLGRLGAQDPTSPWTQHPLQPSRTWDGCGRPCWTRRCHSLSGTAPCLPCATWVARRRLWPWLKVRRGPGKMPGHLPWVVLTIWSCKVPTLALQAAVLTRFPVLPCRSALRQRSLPP